MMIEVLTDLVWQMKRNEESSEAIVRAILKRLREPGDAALRAGKPFAGVSSGSAAKTFAAVIDAILEEK